MGFGCKIDKLPATIGTERREGGVPLDPGISIGHWHSDLALPYWQLPHCDQNHSRHHGAVIMNRCTSSP